MRGGGDCHALFTSGTHRVSRQGCFTLCSASALAPRTSTNVRSWSSRVKFRVFVLKQHFGGQLFQNYDMSIRRSTIHLRLPPKATSKELVGCSGRSLVVGMKRLFAEGPPYPSSPCDQGHGFLPDEVVALRVSICMVGEVKRTNHSLFAPLQCAMHVEIKKVS